MTRLRHLFPLLSILGLLGPSLAGVASAGVNLWTTNGPEGGNVGVFAFDPTNSATIYVGTSTGGMGVFKSTNGGESWTATGLANVTVLVLAIDPSSPSTIYAGTDYNGVFKSRNGGGSWAAINNGLTPPGYIGVYALAIDPATPATIYAGTCNGEGEGGLFRSTNGGESWTLNFGPCIGTLLIDPTAPATLYAGTFNGGLVFKTTDGGQGWTAINTGLTISPEGVSLALHPSSPTTIYAGTAYGIFKSTNGGTSWAAIRTGLGNSDFPPALAIDPSAPATLYAGINHGVFKSTDGGAGWNASSAGLTATGVNAVVIDPSSPATLYAGTDGGVFKSTTGGTSWTTINTGLAYELTDTPNLTVRALAIDPTNPGTLYAGTGGGLAGIRKSTNGGASWTAINAGLTFDLFFSLAIDPTNPATLYAGSFASYLTTVGMFKSTNGGGNWTAISTGLTDIVVSALAIDPSAPETLYAGTRGGGVLKSTNGGSGLTAINTGLTNTEANALAIDPSAPATLYAGTSGGVFKSTNGGGNWTAISTGLTSTVVFALAIDPSAPQTLYAGTRDGGVFKSTNAGGSWTPLNAGLGNLTVHALAIDPSMPNKIYAATDGGVYDYVAIEPPCVPGPTTLCLSGGRFKVTTQWATAAGQSGAGQTVALAGGDTGYFTFFDTGNVEVAVKVLNGCSSNGSFWIFAGGLTDVSVVMTVTDSLTGIVKSYSNPQGTPFRPIQDTDTFATCAAGSTAGVRPYDRSVAGSLLPPSVSESFKTGVTEPCVANATTLCLSNSRYQVRAQVGLPDFDFTGSGQVINLTGDTGAFWFFSPSNVEVVVKVLNGCGLNSRYWTFAGGLTDVNVILTVTDTQTGAVKTYINPGGTPFEPIQDTNAFATCP